MMISIVEKIMLYCPKCNATYEDGSQRFCLNEGGRLLPAPSSIKAAAASKGVFSSFLRNSDDENDELNQTSPRVFVADPVEDERDNKFHTDFSSKVFQDIKNKPANERNLQTLKPLARLVKPNEVSSGTADIGNRQSNPNGREALSWENPKILLGQTIKGRYQITDLLGQDDTSIKYLAEDKIVAGKEMIVRVLMEEKPDDFLSRIFAEERVSLSHINHPNIAGVQDSGELPEGKSFIVTEMIDGFSVKEKLEILGKFEPLRTAKIIRQASNALSEIHQNGILHRNLKPENIFLIITDAVTEQVKVTNFAVSGNLNKKRVERLKYLSPEQLEGRSPNFAGDIYSLAVIAFEMLTGKYPFKFSTAEKLLKAQKQGINAVINDADFDLSPAACEVLEKGLAYEPSDRYPKARDFGDSLYQALSAVEIQNTEENEKQFSIPKPSSLKFPTKAADSVIVREAEPEKKEIFIPAADSAVIENNQKSILSQKESEGLSWENRSPDPLKQGKNSWLWMAGVGLLAVLLAGWLIWNYALNRSDAPPVAQNSAPQTVEPAANPVNNATEQKSSPTPEEVESTPLPRNVVQPPDTEYFQNSSLQLKGELARKYRGFSLYYPKSWQKNESKTNFIDISKTAESGTPIEQFLVSYYDSRGTFKLDSENFPRLVQDSNKKLSQIVANYRLISEGEKTINNGWKGYEMKFEGAGVTANGEKINLWGKRLFIPSLRPGSGFAITMLATSLSPDVKSADDVGIKGELEKILATFEPSTSD